MQTYSHKSLTCMRTHSHMHACLFTATPLLVCGVFEDRVDSMKSKHDQSFTDTTIHNVYSHTHKNMWIHKTDTNNLYELLSSVKAQGHRDS